MKIIIFFHSQKTMSEYKFISKLLHIGTNFMLINTFIGYQLTRDEDDDKINI